MRHLITAIIGGGIFYWLQREFRKFGKGTKEDDARVVMKVGIGIFILATMTFLIPYLIGNNPND